MWLRRRRRAPEPPRNVRVEFADGTVIPCELAYGGVADGMHQWTATAPVALRSWHFRIRADMVPARTNIRLQMVEPES